MYTWNLFLFCQFYLEFGVHWTGFDSDFTPLSSPASISSYQLILLAWSGSFLLCSFFVLLYGEHINGQTGLLPGLIWILLGSFELLCFQGKPINY